MLSFPFFKSHIPPKKVLAIKKNDAEMLTRADIQYDLLHYIFENPSKVFTSQSPDLVEGKVSFKTLYMNALLTSPKCSKSLKDKMKEIPAFAIEFAKIAFLANVGRINTTMACMFLAVFDKLAFANHCGYYLKFFQK